MSHRTRSLELGESVRGRRKELIVFVDTEEGSWCDMCKRRVKVPLVAMDGSVYGGPEVCRPCILALMDDIMVEPPVSASPDPPSSDDT